MNKTIGELNGRWALLFKIHMVLLTVGLIPWCVWATKTIHAQETTIAEITAWKNIGPRFTPSDAEALRLKVKEEIQQEVTQRLADKIDAININLAKINESVERLSQAHKLTSVTPTTVLMATRTADPASSAP